MISKKEDYIFNLNGEKGKPWSGKAATDYAGGSGTENDPYLIETPEQLAKCILSSDFSEGLHFKLTADIILNDTSYNGWQGDAKNWYAGRYNFGGHFDGDGHIVSGLFYNITDGSAMYAGLFPWITANSIIENVGVVNSSITITGGDDVETFAGAITGYIHG